MEDYPDRFSNEGELDEFLTRPRPELVEFVRTLSGPLLLLGVGGKMGPTLAILARRAALAAGRRLEITAASRFSQPGLRRLLEEYDIRTIPCDLMEEKSLARLPDAENVVYLVGLKFGTTQDPAATWAVNTLPPAHTVRRFPESRIAALSSGSLYPLVPVSGGGAREDHPLTPLGEYSNACVARERIFGYFSARNQTRMALLRLFYAVEMRYGVLVDIARKVWNCETVDLAMGYLNWIWQGDANELILRSLDLAEAPAAAYNLTHPQPVAVRDIALRFGELLDRPVRLDGTEAPTALLGDPSRICSRLGPPPTSLDRVMRWIGCWMKQGGVLLGKPTHFEVRDGRY